MIEEEIRRRLKDAFAPTALEIHNESALHAGHAGNPGGGDSHFRIKVTAECFREMSRVARQRAVNKVLQDLIGAPIHALAMEINAPEA